MLELSGVVFGRRWIALRSGEKGHLARPGGRNRRASVVRPLMRFETCRQLARRGYRVILTSRESALGDAAAARLCEEDGIKVEPFRLDLTRAEDIAAFIAHAPRPGLHAADDRHDVDPERSGAGAARLLARVPTVVRVG